MDFDFQFTNYKITSVTFNLDQDAEIDLSVINTKLNYSAYFSEQFKNEFIIVFDIELIDGNGKWTFKLAAQTFFKSSKEISENIKENEIFSIYAPSIAFPYLRTFISNFTLNCGIKPINLPAFNFNKIALQSGHLKHGEVQNKRNYEISKVILFSKESNIGISKDKSPNKILINPIEFSIPVFILNINHELQATLGIDSIDINSNEKINLSFSEHEQINTVDFDCNNLGINNVDLFIKVDDSITYKVIIQVEILDQNEFCTLNKL